MADVFFYLKCMFNHISVSEIQELINVCKQFNKINLFTFKNMKDVIIKICENNIKLNIDL